MKITCMVDNAVCDHSTFWGEHGLAFLIETKRGRILFDTGRSGTVLLHNLELLDIEPKTVNALALSHAHYDHTGGLSALLQQVIGILLHAHPDLFRERFSKREESLKSVGLSLERGTLEQRLAFQLSAEPMEILPGVWTTGEITDRAEPEGRSAHHLVRSSSGSLQGGLEGWEPDPYRDDMALVLETGRGLVVLCGCCHAGLLNTLAHVRCTFGVDITAVAGGTHLLQADEAHLRRVIEVLKELGLPQLYLNHCTGQRAYVTLAQALGEVVAPCPVGTTLEF
ncbi:MAG: MBL fold metallo-hydrolase [Anaerolineae bacterium]|nr:MBL fold metallo-hydrolase [Anaerolineae bacterium]